ncbi:MAG: hypothetical protein J6K22_09535 [Spirochaetaceae bacterium]|nr:hypothetical protein [Spirochaetaceae bacterium]
MIPNIIYAIKCKENFVKLPQTKFWKIIETFEQIGRYGCFACMMFNISGTYFGFSSNFSFRIYLIINGILIFFYCLIWITHFRKNNLFRGISLSVIPSIIFLFSGIISQSILLIIFAIIFAPCHIAISILNTKR